MNPTNDLTGYQFDYNIIINMVKCPNQDAR